MADNTIVNIQPVNADNFEFQNYQESDSGLISSFTINDILFSSSFNTIEYHVLDANQNVITSDYNFINYTLLDEDVTIDPQNDLLSLGFDEGQYYTVYNFITPLLNSSFTNKYFISEISSDRTEIRLSSNTIPLGLIVEGYNNFISSISNLNYFPDFYLNFGDNNLIIANNILLQNDTILIKLYEALPVQFDLKSELWAINKLANSIAYFIEAIAVFDTTEPTIPLKGPNLNISLKDKVNNSTDYYNYTSLQTSVSSSLTNQLNNILKNKSIRLNIDYTDYSNFVHFSSAQTRLENFYYKLSLIESYNQQATSASLSPINNYLSSSQNIYLTKIREIEEKFDGYEYYLYYNSGSTSWPKSNSTQPYVNYPSTSSQGQAWLTGQLSTASIFDSENKDALVNAIPLYLKEDPENAQYELFVEMLGQHFDILYLYYEEVSNKYNSDNRIDYGLSRDVVSDALKDFGIKIYQNNFSTNDLYSSFLGITNNLNLLPPTGSELITNYITASNSVIPLEDVNVSTYKRIYHNLPLLFKKKGTVEGLRLLINTYGIPDTILRISEFGGKNKINANDWDQFQDQFNYEFFTTSSGFVSKAIPSGITSASLSTVEFRFKTTGIPVAATSSFSQSLASFSGSAYDLVIEYTGSGYATGSYSSSVVNPEYQYGTLKLISGSVSASVYLPIFDGNWWSVLTTCYAGTSSLYLKNKIYSGYDGNKIGFQASSSFTSSGFWINSVSASNFYLSYSSSKSIAGKTYTPFSGSFQELRFYSVAISESVFNDYVMNPYSIESNQLSGSQTSQATLIFRAPLGSELDKSGSARTSVHPGISYYPVTQSFSSGNSIYTFSGSYSFVPNTEVIYLDQFSAGIRNIISNKIKIESTFIPAGDTLSALRSLQQNFEVSQSYTRDVNYVEVAFSPQNEINEDIISQLGYFNIGNYIGDPRQLINKKITEYTDFNQLRDQYFAKYSSSYNLVDYVRLIKYFDNSLFKLIKDFVPARTSLATGIVIKQHLLERNKYAPAQGSYEFEDYSGSVKSFPYNYEESPLYKPSANPGGVMPELNGSTSSSFVYPGAINLTQSWSESFVGPTGLSYINHIDQKEFFDGELQGTELVATDGNLNGDNIFLSLVQPESNYKVRFYNYNSGSWYESVPKDGEINFLVPSPTNQGDAFVKISKKDSQGNNYSLSLAYLDSFKLQYPNATIYYDVLSKAEYNSYFVYSYQPTLNATPPYTSSIILNFSASASLTTSSIEAYIANGYQNGGNTTFSSKAIKSETVIFDALNYFTASYENFKTSIDITASLYTLRDYINVPLTIEASVDLVSADLSPWSGRLFIFKQHAYTPTIPQVSFDNINIHMSTGVSILAVGTLVAGGPGIPANALVSVVDPNPRYGDSYLWAFTSENDASSITASNAYLNVKLVNPVVTGLAQTGSSDLIFYSPYLPKPFEGGDYDSLYNNVSTQELSQYIQELDPNYLTNTTFFQYILSGSATKADVKDYYYNLRRHIYPRYLGSRQTTDNFNTSSVSQALQTQFSQSLWLNPKPNDASIANGYFTTIYEFDNGLPILEFPGRIFKLNPNQIISTDNTSSAVNIKPYIDNNFLFTVQSQFDTTPKSYTYTTGSNIVSGKTFKLGSAGIAINKPSSANLSISQYSPNSNVATANVSLFPSNVIPSQSAYWIPSNFTNPAGVQMIGGGFSSPSSISSSLLYTSGSIPTVVVQNDGTYITGSLVNIVSASVEVYQSILSGSRWFISTFAYLPNVYSNNGFGRTSISLEESAPLYLQTTNPPDILLNSLGIYEIFSCSIDTGYYANFYTKTNSTFLAPKEYGNNVGNTNNFGCIIWKATENAPVIAVDNNLSGLGKGNILPYHVSPFIKNNLDYIVENFGNKPKT